MTTRAHDLSENTTVVTDLTHSVEPTLGRDGSIHALRSTAQLQKTSGDHVRSGATTGLSDLHHGSEGRTEKPANTPAGHSTAQLKTLGDHVRRVADTGHAELTHSSKRNTDRAGNATALHTTDRLQQTGRNSVRSGTSAGPSALIHSSETAGPSALIRSSETAGPSALIHSSEGGTKTAANTSHLLVTAQPKGRLGNLLFEYASLLGIAHRNGRTAVYPKKSGLAHYFYVTHIADVRSMGFQVVEEKNFASYDPRFERLPEENVKVGAFLQSWKYFHTIRHTVRKELTFKQEVKDDAARLLRAHSEQIGNRTRIGIHVRRGDMLMAGLVKRGYHVAPASYVNKAMTYMRGKYGDVIFLVFSTDSSWCLENIKSDFIMVDMAPATVHLALLASCDHVIMTVGTFGWWGGYLSGGEVVYYWDKDCLHSPPLPVEIHHPEDFYPPKWTPLPA